MLIFEKKHIMVLPLNIPAHQYFTDKTPTFALSSSNNSELITEIGIWNRQHKAGKVLESNGGFFLEDSSMRVPDVAWIHIDRWNALSKAEKRSFPRMAPDFVIELKSETDALSDLQVKMTKWVENGVRLAWLICPDSQTTYIYEPGKPQLIMHFEETLSGGEVLVAFSVRLSDILEY
jgi:Uma2 family endonuclease